MNNERAQRGEKPRRQRCNGALNYFLFFPFAGAARSFRPGAFVSRLSLFPQLRSGAAACKSAQRPRAKPGQNPKPSPPPRLSPPPPR